MSINSYLENLASELVLSDNEKNRVATSVESIKEKLGTYFGDEVTDKIMFGSYTRGTILPRKADEESDIDLMVVFDNSEGYKPQRYLNHLKDFAEKYYSKSEIYQSSPTIVLELQHIKFELVPAYIHWGTVYIPDGPTYWMMTDPNGFNNALVKCNKNNDYKIKPIVRLLKHWNIEKNYRDLASFKLEKTIASEMEFAYIFADSYTDYIKQGLEKLKGYTDYHRVNSAIEHINKAIAYEDDGKMYSALDEIKKVFPELR